MQEDTDSIPWLQHQKLSQLFCNSETWMGYFQAVALNADGTDPHHKQPRKQLKTSDSFDLSGTAKVFPLHISAALLENTTKLKSEANLRKLNNYISLQRSINILHIRNNEHQWLQSILKKKSESNILRQKCAWVMKFVVKNNMNSNNTIYSPAVMHVSNCRNEL